MSSALDEFKKPMEEWARATVDGKPMENLLILYKLLYAMGCRIDGIEFEIDRLCLAAIKKKKHSRNPLSPLRSPRKDCPWNEGTNLQILSIVGVVELLAWQIVIARRVDAQNIKRRLRNSNFGLVVEVGIGEINNKSPQPVYAVSVDRYSADLTADDSYEITNRLNSVFRRRLKQSESGADHIGAQKKHSTVQSELCIDSPLHARLSPAEQDLLGKVQRFFNEVV